MTRFHPLLSSRRAVRVMSLCIALVGGTLAQADSLAPYPGTLTVPTPFAFAETVSRLEKSVEANKMD